MLLPLSGVLIVGVGDTAASVYGKLRGRTPWCRLPSAPPKTVEGTLAGSRETASERGRARRARERARARARASGVRKRARESEREREAWLQLVEVLACIFVG
jgi:hypothetical protein